MSAREFEETKAQAFKYRDPKTDAEAKQHKKSSRVKYSGLWRLDYFDPMSTIVDPMHAVLLGLVQREADQYLCENEGQYTLDKIQS